MPHRKSKKPRGNGGSKHAPDDDGCCLTKVSYHDMMVPIPSDKDRAVRQLKVQQTLDRLEFLGYSSIALVHQVYGKPKDTIVVDQLFEPYEQQVDAGITTKKRRKRTLQIYRRLHAVVENISDIAHFNNPKLLQSYDLVSVAPCNESIFHAACSSMVDMITLDYSRGGGLPFKIRSSHIQAAVDHNIAIEVPYTPSIFHLPHRKALIQTVRALQSASVGKKVQLIVSSASSDANVMGLRSPGDMANVLETIACLEPAMVRGSQSTAVEWVLEEARKRRLGVDSHTVRTSVVQVRISNHDEIEESQEVDKKEINLSDEKSGIVNCGKEDKDEPEVEKGDVIEEDGFITL